MNKPSSVIPGDQIDKFLREAIFLHHEMSSLSHHYVTTELPEEHVTMREHLDRFFSRGGSSRRAENVDQFYNVCLALSGQGRPLTMGELSLALHVPLSKATRIIDWLVDGNYAERLSDPLDRRVVRVALTDKGMEIYRILNEFTRQRMTQVLEGFTDEERVTLISLMHRLAIILSEVKRKVPG
jgi:DNA-binding MarR family transcriptional regulator